jgi:hypothetical protein
MAVGVEEKFIEITIEKDTAEQIRAISTAQNVPESQVSEQLLRLGLEAYSARYKEEVEKEGR